MTWTRRTATALCLAVSALAALALSCATTSSPPAPMTQQQKIERGEYLTTIMGCNDCHTPGTFYGAPDFERKLAGSELGWVGPWGTSYARNLTPDAETGIGNWSEDDIVKAIRTGQRADGSPVLPPMPWPMFSRMPDEDAYAVAAYLRSLPPVLHKVPDKLPPGAKVTGAALVFPPPPAWDAPKAPPQGTPADSTRTSG